MSSSARRNLSSSCSLDSDLDDPVAFGQFRYVAMGTYTNGPRCHQPCALKWFKTGAVYEDVYYEKDLKAVDKAQDFIDAWNHLNISNTIHLNHPEVWVFRPGSRYAGQKHLVEPWIDDYQKFNSNSGWACDRQGWCEVMQALSHFSYHKSGGQMVVCDLQGGIFSRGRGAVLTDPVIMSRTRSYGVTDLGPDGISTFFARHQCNSYCQPHWQAPRNVAVHYPEAACTTMELYGERHLYGGARGGGGYDTAPIYEEESDGYYSDSDSDSDDY